MSYSIIYDKQFIKAEKAGKTVFFPMLLWGPSNCYESGRNGKNGRRVRDWSLFSFDNKRFGSLEEMLKNINQQRTEHIERNKIDMEKYENWGEYSDNEYGYYSSLSIGGRSTRRTTFSNFKSVFVSGCKNALTVEELRSFGITVRVYTDSYSDDTLKRKGKTSIDFYPQTSEELVENLEKYEEYLKDVPTVQLWVSMNASERTMDRIKSARTTKK